MMSANNENINNDGVEMAVDGSVTANTKEKFDNASNIATALEKIARLSKENIYLNKQIEKYRNSKQIRSIPWLTDFFYLDQSAYIKVFFELYTISINMGYEINEPIDYEDVLDIGFSFEAIDLFRENLLEDPDFMEGYRKDNV